MPLAAFWGYLREHPRFGRLFGEGWRFLLAGGFNTLFTFLLYQGLLWIVGEKTAWTLAWLAGIALVTVLYPKKVFQGGKLTPIRAVLNVAYYAVMFLVSLGLLATLVDSLGIHPRLAALGVLCVTVPLNFIFSRLIFTKTFRS